MVLAIFKYEVKPGRIADFMAKLKAATDPRGRPGFLRIDTAHQGDWDGVKGVYHINAVDAVTQWLVLGCVSEITRQEFGDRIHQEPGQPQCRPRSCRGQEWSDHTQAHGLRTYPRGACRGGAEVLPDELAPLLEFSPAVWIRDRELGRAGQAGKRKREYKREDYATPYEKPKTLAETEKYLKPKMTFARLDEAAMKMSDTECARKISLAKTQLLRNCKIESPGVPQRM